MIELHGELQCALETKKQTDREEHLGHGAHAQDNKFALEIDAREGNPVTITRKESRSVLYHDRDALMERSDLCVTGQPGIGKTRVCMMYAIQTLLYQQAAMLQVKGYASISAEKGWSIQGMEDKGF